MSGQIDEIKARVDVIDLISEYIRLKQTGTNWRALCPFHNEKSPSFMASRDKQIWHCFGCGEGGDIFTFVEKMEGVEFVEALKILAQKAGIKLENQDPKLSNQKTRLLDITRFAQDFWHKTLMESQSAQKARDYLQQRGVKSQTITEFKFGYAVDSWDVLINALQKKGYKDQEIFLAGLSVKKDRGAGFYDRFRDRVMFPINDLHGSPIGFSGRTLKEDEKGGKYINTPQTLIYNKSLAVFNLDKAKQDIKKLNQAIVVEGQMDVISAWQAGTRNVIASSGTALTLDQINTLKRYTNNLAIAFDTDSAGQAAAKRGIDLAISQGMNVQVIVLPEGKDPDECIKNNPDDWRRSITDSKSIIDYYFDETFAKVNLATVEGKKQAAKILLTEIAKLPDQIEQTHYLQKLSESIKVPEDILRNSIDKEYQVKKSEGAPPASSPTQAPGRDILLGETILAIGLKYPHYLPYLIDNLNPEIITDSRLSNLYKKAIIYYTEDIAGDIDQFDYQAFKTKIKSNELESLSDKLVLLAEKDFFDFKEDALKKELIQAIKHFKKNFYNSKLKSIEEQIQEAEKQKNQQKVKELEQESMAIIAQINILN